MVIPNSNDMYAQSQGAPIATREEADAFAAMQPPVSDAGSLDMYKKAKAPTELEIKAAEAGMSVDDYLDTLEVLNQQAEDRIKARQIAAYEKNGTVPANELYARIAEEQTAKAMQHPNQSGQYPVADQNAVHPAPPSTTESKSLVSDFVKTLPELRK
jgi:hypothetical protein